MAIPRSSAARVYYRAAWQRAEEATALLDMEYTTAAVYLGGYGIECTLKALIVCSVPPRQRDDVVRGFRGAQGHDLDWLRRRYLLLQPAPIPSLISKELALANTWTTDLRYEPRTIRRHDAELFHEAVQAIMQWANERIH